MVTGLRAFNNIGDKNASQYLVKRQSRPPGFVRPNERSFCKQNRVTGSLPATVDDGSNNSVVD